MTATPLEKTNQGEPRTTMLVRTLIAYVVTPDGVRRKARLLLDSGSSVSLVRAQFAREINLTGERAKLALSVCGGSTVRESAQMHVQFRLQSIFSDYTSPIIEAITINKIGVLPAVTCCLQDQFANLSNIVFTERFPRAPDIELDVVIGEPAVSFLVTSPAIMTNPNLPYFVKTRLGNSVCGPVPSEMTDGPDSYMCMRASIDAPAADEELASLLKKFNDIEDFHIQPGESKLTVEEQQTQDHLEKHTIYLKDKKAWQVTLPWNQKRRLIVDSGYGAEMRREVTKSSQAL